MWCHHTLMGIEQCGFRFWHLNTLDCTIYNLKCALWWGGGRCSYHLSCCDSNFTQCFSWPSLKINKKNCYKFLWLSQQWIVWDCDTIYTCRNEFSRYTSNFWKDSLQQTEDIRRHPQHCIQNTTYKNHWVQQQSNNYSQPKLFAETGQDAKHCTAHHHQQAHVSDSCHRNKDQHWATAVL